MVGFIFRVKPPPTTNSRYLLRGTKFKFLVKTKKFLGGVASMGAKPPGAVRPQGGTVLRCTLGLANKTLGGVFKASLRSSDILGGSKDFIFHFKVFQSKNINHLKFTDSLQMAASSSHMRALSASPLFILCEAFSSNNSCRCFLSVFS